MSRFAFSFPTSEISLRVADDICGIVIDAHGIERVEAHRLKVIVSELFVNAYLHGNKVDPDKTIEVVLEIKSDGFVAIIKDNGDGLSREKMKALSRSVVDPGSENGRGLGITHSLADRVDSFRDTEGRFCVRVMKKIKDIKNTKGLLSLKAQ